MPSTRARTCATKYALVRPGRSIVTGTLARCTVATDTSGGCAAGAGGFLPQPLNPEIIASIAMSGAAVRGTAFEVLVRNAIIDASAHVALETATAPHRVLLSCKLQSDSSGFIVGTADGRWRPFRAAHRSKCQRADSWRVPVST